jgi:hypothetical protein
MSNTLRLVLLAIAAIVVFVTGFLLTRAGRPYSTGILTLHKIIDLAAVIFIVVQVVMVARGAGLATIDWALVGVALLLVIATFATGGILSASEQAAGWLLTAHRLLPWPLLVVLAGAMYRLGAR